MLAKMQDEKSKTKARILKEQIDHERDRFL